MKKFLLAPVFVVFIIITSIPSQARAETAAELQQRLNALVQQLNSLKQQLSSGGGSPAAANSAAFDCPYISRTLKLGSTGEDVSRLQKFLASDQSIYPEAQISGYYGSLTEAAVERFQEKNKIVSTGSPETTGYGVVGPRTAAILALQCPERAAAQGNGTGTQTGGTAPQLVGGYIRVTPLSGNAPLSVSVEANVNTTNTCTAAQYVLDYGDGSGQVTIYKPENLCQAMTQVYQHVYQVPGTYVITLRSGTSQTTANVSVLNSISNASDSFNASPSSGTIPLTISFTGNINTNASCGSGSYTIDFGDGQTADIPYSGCVAQSYVVNHLYSTASAFTARLYRGSISSGAIVGSASIQATTNAINASDARQFSVTPFVNDDAYTVRAVLALVSNCAAFELDWGDGSSRVSQPQGSCTAGSTAVTKQFTHTYGSEGSYVVTLKRGSDLSLSDSLAVVIAD